MESCSVPKKTAELLGISARTVYKYLKKKPEEIETPGKTRKRKCVGGVGDIDEFTRAHILRIIYSMTGRGEHLTLNTMLQAIKSSGDPGFQGSRSALYRLLKKEGFAWKKTDGCKVLLEDPRISSLRANFLREYQRLKKEGAVFVFLDETWFFSKGLICAEGALWKDQRKFVSTCLKSFGMVKFGAKRAKLEKRIMCGVKECVEDLGRAAGGGALDPVHALQHCLGNVVNSLVFGRTWPEHDAVWRWLRRLQEDGTKLVGVAGPVNFLPFLRVLPRYRRTMQYLMSGKEKTHQVYQSLIEERAAALRQQQEGGGGDGGAADPPECEDVLAAFLAEMTRRRRRRHGSQGPPGVDGDAAEEEEEKEEEDFFSTPQFHHLLADLFGAGLDTTLTTLRWFLLYMAAHPDVQVRLQSELDGVLVDDARRLPALDDADALPLTAAAIAETQRIRSVVPLGIPHGAVEDTELAGYHIPRGTMFVPLQWAVHMDPEVWPEPEVFDPARFLAEDGSFRRPEAFIPFQTGKRMCVGEDLARMMLFLFGAAIVHQFRIRPPEGSAVDLQGEVGITLTPRPQALVFEPRF